MPTTRELEISARVRTRQADSGLWPQEHVGVQETSEMWDACVWNEGGRLRRLELRK